MFFIKAVGAGNLEYWQFIIYGISVYFTLMNVSMLDLKALKIFKTVKFSLILPLKPSIKTKKPDKN